MNIDSDSEAYDEWYYAIGKKETGGTTVSLDDVRARRDEILHLAEDCGASNVRLVGAILDAPLEPEETVEFLVDYDPERSGGIKFFSFNERVVRLLSHYVTVHRASEADDGKRPLAGASVAL